MAKDLKINHICLIKKIKMIELLRVFFCLKAMRQRRIFLVLIVTKNKK